MRSRHLLLLISWRVAYVFWLLRCGGGAASVHCSEWAAAGECSTNPAYMLDVCSEACSTVAEANCREWAALGECMRNPDYMSEACSRACNELGNAATPASDTGDISKEPSKSVATSKLATAGKIVEKEEDPHNCESLPGGCKCYYDPLNLDCPGSYGGDGAMAMCSCEYNDNTWLHVLGSFIQAFRLPEQERSAISGLFSVQMEPGGVLSMEVGYSEHGSAKRLECGAPLVNAYPGTSLEVALEELDQFGRNIFWPEVRQKLNELCIPGRVALGLLCLHAELIRKNVAAVVGYARQLGQLIPRIQGCIHAKTPWPMPGIDEYAATLQKASKLNAHDQMQLRSIMWLPDVRRMRAKQPEESESHYWPCVPIKDKSCFPTGTPYKSQSCESCCDPGAGPTGDATCFDNVFTFRRCCRTPGNQGRFW